MKPHHFTITEINGLGFSNGIYVIFEEGEMAHKCKRIVRVGTHRELDYLQNRLNQHRRNGGTSIFRRKIGCAILNKCNPNDPDLKWWYEKKYKSIEYKKRAIIRNSVTEHIVNKTTFVAFETKGTTKEEKGTQFWEAKIISTVAQCNECSPSNNWLGNYMPEKFGELKVAKENGLWLSNEIDSPILNDTEFGELVCIIKQSRKKYG
jgi:hypothetical protein